MSKIKVGDQVTLRSAILFGLETYFRRELKDGIYKDAKIFWGRETFSQDEANSVVISFIEPPKPADIPPAPDQSPIRTYQWAVFIQGMLPDSPGQPTFPAYELSAELKRLLIELEEKGSTQTRFSDVNNLLNLGPRAQSDRGSQSNLSKLEIGMETVRGPGEHSNYAFFWLPIYLTITEDMKNPRVTAQNPL